MNGRGISPIYVFDDINQFNLRHRGGTEVEFNNESKDISEFNDLGVQFRAWVISSLGKSRAKSYWLFLVAPGDKVEWRLPREGESCRLKLLSNSGKSEKSDWFEAERIDNPAASLGLAEEEWQRFCAFKVKVPRDVPEGFIRPMQGDDDDNLPQTGTNRWEHKSIKVKFLLNVSAATKEAEIAALDKLFFDHKENRTSKQKAAFEYLMNFKNPAFSVNLFRHFPHLKDPLSNLHGLPKNVVTFLKGFNEHQRAAYRYLLGDLPCGICIIPGGPGAGKTHWNLILTCAIQSLDSVVYGPDNASNKSAKVLYLLDINKPLDDTANKMMRLYKELGLRKKVVRLYGWHYGSKKSKEPEFASKFMTIARLKRFRTHTRANPTCLAPTLDEAAWDHYLAYKNTKYQELSFYLETALKSSPSAELMSLVNDLYRDVLDNIDFIATTPVPAATGFDGLFKPDLVFFDESPHARELSTLIAIANYEPLAWIFSGDHRQTRPFVASDDVRDNPYAPQMLVSTMERAHRAGAIKHSLLINHRAYAGLQHLASGLFYNQAMVSGHNEDKLFPPTVRYLQKYLEKFMDGRTCKETRLIVCTDYSNEKQAGTSWYNDGHQQWVMARAQELLQDPMFKRINTLAERGTILIIAPYKEAFHRYKRAIKQLPPAMQNRCQVESRLEARTIDTVQGNEADFVFLDFVRHHGTEFTDDPNRLCVALTRARQAEIIMMNPGMCVKGTSYLPTAHLSRIWNHSAGLGQIVRIRKGAAQGSLLGNATIETWTPRLAAVDSSVLDNTSKSTVVSTPQAGASREKSPPRADRPLERQSSRPEKSTQDLKGKTVEQIRPQNTTAIEDSSKDVKEKKTADKPRNQHRTTALTWQDCLDELMGTQSHSENDPAHVDSAGLNNAPRQPAPSHWDLLDLSSEVVEPKREATDRPEMPASTQAKASGAKTKLTVAERETLPSGSDWW